MSKETKTREAALGIDHMAKHLGVTPVVARDKLRRAGLTPNGGKWSWSNKAKLEADAKKVSKPADKKSNSKPAAKAKDAGKGAAKSKDKAAA